MTNLSPATRLQLARDYADGKKTVRELREAGHYRMIEVLSDLNELGRRVPLADMVGPNVDTRRLGMARLTEALKP